MGYPSLSDRISEVTSQVGSGAVPGNLTDVFVRRTSFYHNVTIVDAGVTANQAITAFNGTVADHTTNFPAGGLPTDTAFWMTGMSITPVEAGGTAGLGLQTTVTDAASGSFSEYIKWIKDGLVRLQVGERKAVEAYGVWRFGTGAGAFGLYGSNATAGTNVGQGFLNNGNGNSDSVWRFTPWFLVLPQKAVQATVQYNLAIDPADTSDWIFRFELHGLLITPSNN